MLLLRRPLDAFMGVEERMREKSGCEYVLGGGNGLMVGIELEVGITE